MSRDWPVFMSEGGQPNLGVGHHIFEMMKGWVMKKYSSVNGVGHINFEQQSIAQCKLNNHVVYTS